MGDGGLGVVGERGAGRDVVDAWSAGAGVALVAADGVRVDVGYWTVALEIGCGSDILPVSRVADAWESI